MVMIRCWLRRNHSQVKTVAKIIPFRRSLKRGSVGKDVVAVKRALSAAGYLKWTTRWSLTFGLFTVRALKRFQSQHGLAADGVYGKLTHAKLAHWFDAWSAILYAHGPVIRRTASDKRQVIVAAALLGYRNRYSIHYTQGPSRMQGVRHHLKPPQFPNYEDCSSFATWCYYAAGVRDPNGLGYNGYGYTGTLGAHGHRVSNPQPGDLCLYGSAPRFHHVTIYIGAGKCVSHGGEPGPLLLPVHYRSDLAEYRSYF
jgi:cell wall-associated NlpC family hydrolase